MPRLPPRIVAIGRAFASEFRSYGADELCAVSGPRDFSGRLTTGCIYHGDGALEPLAERSGGRGDRVLNVNPGRLSQADLDSATRTLPGRTAFLGYFMNHYGHFLTEFVSRLWFARDAARFDHFACFPFVFDGGRILPAGAHRYILERLGISLDNIVVLREPQAFEELWVPEQLWAVNRQAHPALTPIYQRIREPHIGASSPRRVFLSRIAAAESDIRGFNRVSNVSEVEAVFQTRGFEILYPETADFRRQLDVYANADVIASFSGSALHNCVFFKPGALMIELGDTRCPDAFHPMQLAANALSGVHARRISFSGDGAGALDVNHLVRALDQILASIEQTAPGWAAIARR